MWTCQIHQMIMGENANLITLKESDINAIKKSFNWSTR